jgi:hypothetical protein
MKKLMFPFVALLLITSSCKKDAVKSCWYLVDCAGFLLPEQCDKTEAEIKAFANANPACVVIYRRIE